MKKLTLMALLVSAVLSTQAATIGIDSSTWNISVFGHLITPTHDAQLFQLEQDPWWGSSDLARQYAQGYYQAVFSFEKYNNPSLVEQIPVVYFAYASDGGDYADTWAYDWRSNKLYNEDGNSIKLLIGLDPPPGGWKTVPDVESSAAMGIMGLMGLAVVRWFKVA